MTQEHEDSIPQHSPGDVAMWHRLSGLPDNVTDEGEIVAGHAGLRTQAEKAQLRAEIARLREAEDAEVRALARLAAGYVLAGDVETARRYVNRAQERLADI
jgi:hypothetical protein